MKTRPAALLLALIASLAGSRLPAAAADPSNAEPVQQTTDFGWSRVRTVAPGAEITVTIRGSQAAPRYFVAADDAGMVTLNLTDPALPPHAARALRQIASQHRDYLTGAAKGGTFFVDNVRLEPAGVFVTDKKVADLHVVVELSTRQEIAAIKTRQKARGMWGHLGPIGGYFVGGMAGGFAGGLICRAANGPGRCDTGAFLTGLLAGGAAGGVYGLYAGNRQVEAVIYRAP